MSQAPHPPSGPPPFWRSRTGLALAGFMVVAAFFLVSEHRAHVFGLLPFVLVTLCPLMHLFGHGGHRHRDKEDRK